MCTCMPSHAMQMHVQEMHNVAVGAIACLTCTSAIAHLHRHVMRCQRHAPCMKNFDANHVAAGAPVTDAPSIGRVAVEATGGSGSLEPARAILKCSCSINSCIVCMYPSLIHADIHACLLGPCSLAMPWMGLHRSEYWLDSCSPCGEYIRIICLIPLSAKTCTS